MRDGARTLANLAWEGEHRADRPYDQQDPSHYFMPNGSLVASYHRGFLTAAAIEVLRVHLLG